MLRPKLTGAMVVLLTITGLMISTPGAAAAGTLGAISFTPSSTTTAATGVSFSYAFVPATSHNVSAVSFTVPSGTTGTPQVAAATAWSGYAIALNSPAASLSGTTLTVSFSRVFLPSGANVAVTVAGLTNPTAAVTTASTVKTLNGPSVVDQGTSAPISWTATAATSAYWSASTSLTGASGVVERYGLTTASAATIDAIQLVLPPDTGGSPVLTAVTPAAIAGGSVTLAGQILTYTFTATSIEAGTPLALTVSGLTNPTVPGSYASVVTTERSATAVDAAAVAAVSFASGALTGLSWSPSTTATGASGVAYTAGFTIPDAGQYTAFTLNLPPGTSGTPNLTSLAVVPSFDTPASASVAVSGGQLLVTFPQTFLQANAVITIEVGGLTNTPTAGAYPMPIAVLSAGRAVDVGVAPAVSFTNASLTSLSWSVSSSAVGATGVSSTVGFSISATTTLTSITMSLPPATGGTPLLGTVTPTALAGGSLTLSGQTLTYTLPTATTLAAGTTVSVQTTGLTNTPTAQAFAATVAVLDGADAQASGVTPAVTFTATSLTALTWASSSTAVGADTTYTFGFTTASAVALSSVTMTVPAGTGGTPALGTVGWYSTSQRNQTLGAASISLSGTKLSLSFSSMYVDSNTQVSIEVTGLTNTSSTGTYTSAITTGNANGAVDSGTTPAITLAAAFLSDPSWTASSTATAMTGVTYTFKTAPSMAITVNALRMSVPGDTGGTPTVGTVVPASIRGGTITLADGVLTYTMPAVVTLAAGTAISIEITGITNTAVAGSYASTITATDDGSPVASGTAPALGFTATVLTSLSWTTSSTITAETNVSYTFGFTTSTAQALSGVQFAVPAGTAGAPTVGALTAQQANQGAIALTSPSISLTGSVLTLTFTSVYVPTGTVFSVRIDGLTNAGTAGTYTATIATRSGSHSIDSGTTPPLTLTTRYVSLTPPSALRWTTAALGGTAVVDTVAEDQAYSVVDATGTNAGWNVAVSATTFTDGTHTLPDAGTFSINGSLTSAVASIAPSVTCTTICTAPVNSLSYPIAIPTAATGPTAVRIFSAAAGSGAGSFTIGGSSTSAPLGWWVHLPTAAYAGTYTSTITFSISTGP
jgi:hypothetical protein